MSPSFSIGPCESQPELWQANRIKSALTKKYFAPTADPVIVKTTGKQIPPLRANPNNRSGSAEPVEYIGTDLVEHMPANGVDKFWKT